MKSVLIITTHHRTEEGLRSQATRQGLETKYRFDTTASFGQEASWWITDGPDLLVIMMPDDEVLQGFFIQKLVRDLPKYLPIVIIANSVTPEFLKLSARFKKLRALKGPVAHADLFKMVSELVADRPPKERQRHQRYDVNQRAMVRIGGETQDLEVEVKNLSLGGAYLELQGLEDPPAVGDRLLVEMEAKEFAKAYAFTAEVVWVKTVETGLGMGVRFVHDGQVLQELLQEDED